VLLYRLDLQLKWNIALVRNRFVFLLRARLDFKLGVKNLERRSGIVFVNWRRLLRGV
jgi:hypothetical protein